MSTTCAAASVTFATLARMLAREAPIRPGIGRAHSRACPGAAASAFPAGALWDGRMIGGRGNGAWSAVQVARVLERL